MKATPILERVADVNGVRLHYLVAGKGDPVILLHGYAQTSHMWRPLIARLARTHTVVAPDLRGFDRSSKPEPATTRRPWRRTFMRSPRPWDSSARQVVGHDIGLMVAYAYAAQYPAEVDRLALMDAFLPGVGNWRTVWLLRDLWHFHFYGEVPLKLVAGRERIYFEHFWNDFAADREAFRPGSGPTVLCGGLRAPGRHACRLRSVPRIRAGCEGLRGLRTGRSCRCRCWFSPERRHPESS